MNIAQIANILKGAFGFVSSSGGVVTLKTQDPITTPGAYPYTALPTDGLILATGTVNLIASPTNTASVVIKNTSSSVISVLGNGNTMDTVTTFSLNPYSSNQFTFSSTNNSWNIL